MFMPLQLIGLLKHILNLFHTVGIQGKELY